MHRFPLLAVAGLLLGITACQSPGTDAQTTRSASPPVTAEEHPGDESTYQAVGVVRSVTPSGSHIVIRHEDIPGFMDAMTMAFAVADSVPVQALERDDRIRFTFVSGVQGAVIQHIEPVVHP